MQYSILKIGVGSLRHILDSMVDLDIQDLTCEHAPFHQSEILVIDQLSNRATIQPRSNALLSLLSHLPRNCWSHHCLALLLLNFFAGAQNLPQNQGCTCLKLVGFRCFRHELCGFWIYPFCICALPQLGALPFRRTLA